MMKKRNKVLCAISGGLDSSITAALLKKQGYDVIGAFLQFAQNNTKGNIDKHISENVCCNREALRSARTVASKLGIPFYVFDVAKDFKREVVDYYISEYDAGRTPNPCVVCNKKIKFGWLLEKAKKLGCDYLATGHYVRIKRKVQSEKHKTTVQSLKFQRRNPLNLRDSSIISRNDTIHLFKPKDKKKDQTYFLWQLDQEQLQHLLFPLGNYTKPEVRKMAKEWKLPVYNKKESQNICFVPDGDNADFLRTYVKKSIKHGNIVDKTENVLGRHEGLYKYTVGQRQGLPQLKISNFQFLISNKNPNVKCQKPNFRKDRIPPLYVLRLNIDKNELVVGEKKDLFSKELTAINLNWITEKLSKLPFACGAKIRYGHNITSCKLKTKNKKQKTVEVVFNKPQRAITPGQSVVFYKREELIGGGTIQ